MPEHRIRFRGGWESSPVEGSPGIDRRLTLPILWPAGVVGPVRLIRRFGRPPIDPSAESTRLELLAVPGLRALHLNGIDLGRPTADVFDWFVPLTGSLSVRNILTLEVDLGRASPVDLPGGWGAIALVIVPVPGSEG